MERQIPIFSVILVVILSLCACTKKAEPTQALEKYFLEESSLKQTAWEYYTISQTSSGLVAYIIFPERKAGVTRMAPVKSEVRRLCPDSQYHSFWKDTGLSSFDIMLIKNVDVSKGKAKRLVRLTCKSDFKLVEYERSELAKKEANLPKTRLKPIFAKSDDEKKWFADFKEASRVFDKELAKIMLKKNPERVALRDENGDSLLHNCNSPDIVQVLIDAGADVNAKNKDKTTPLITVVSSTKPDAAKLLIANGADVNAVNKFEFSPISAAKTVEMAEYLVKQGARVPKDALHRPAFYGRLELAVYLHSQGAKIDARDSNGQTPLFKAVAVYHDTDVSIAMAEWLLEKGADINAVDKFGYTAYNQAMKKSEADKKMLEFLVKHGAKPGR